jgi:hypothetical protein
MINRIISKIEDLLNNSAEKSGYSDIRFNKFWFYKRPDNNVFGLASAAFILLQNIDYLSVTDKTKARNIINNIATKYPKYKNKDGSISYNFYQTMPSMHFPAGYIMNKFDHFRLPDDIDDTAMVFLTSKKTIEEVKEFKKFAAGFSEYKINKQTDQKTLEIYNTWFGKKMPKEQDACALLNFMYFVFNNNLPLEIIDINTLNFLANQIVDIKNEPFTVARHYGNTALILYHYARFMGMFKVEELENQKPLLIQLAAKELENETVFLNKIILEIALIKWGQKRQKLAIDINGQWSKGFYSFIGAPFAPFVNLIFCKIASKKWAQIFWKSKILELAILLEYEMLTCKN